MGSLVFETTAHAPRSAPERADIALFVGFVRRRPGVAISSDVQRWLVEQRWAKPTGATGLGYAFDAELPDASSHPLDDVPVVIDRWEAFDRLFAWQDGSSGESGTYLGAAIRSFFAQGGRKCYVVRVADPPARTASRTERIELLQKLLAGTGKLFVASPVDRASWKGAAHLFGLSDVSFLCMPDIATLVAPDPDPLPSPPAPMPAQEVFVECTEVAEQPTDSALSQIAAPRCDEQGYAEWARFVERVRNLVARYAREVQFVASIPLPRSDARESATSRRWLAEENLYAFLLAGGFLPRVQSAFVQLAFPWVKTPGSLSLPEGVESPDAVLVGILARNALQRGTFRNATGQSLADVRSTVPVWGSAQWSSRPPIAQMPASPNWELIERISLFGMTPSGLRVLSDTTTSTNEAYRQGQLNRLFSSIVRAARTAGEDILFSPSGPRVWGQLIRRIETVFVRLWDAGALRGSNARDAFSIRCDRTTMTQDDIDNGRLVAEVEFDPAAAIERIRIVLTLADGGSVSLSTGGAP